MAIILCADCELWVDDDYDPCEERPDGQLICPECAMKRENETPGGENE